VLKQWLKERDTDLWTGTRELHPTKWCLEFYRNSVEKHFFSDISTLKFSLSVQDMSNLLKWRSNFLCTNSFCAVQCTISLYYKIKQNSTSVANGLQS
jgi:hypothetical protein